jgi:hypothetical protein
MRVFHWRAWVIPSLTGLFVACSGPNPTVGGSVAAANSGNVIEKVGLADQAQPAAPAKIELSCLAGRDLRSELRGGGGMTVLRDACAAELAVAVDDWNLGPIERDAILATFVAYHVAPYGPSVAVTFDKLMTETGLDCDNYVMLTGYLFRELHPNERLIYVGFDGGKIGNHAQAFVTNGASSVLLDPTVGVVANISFDDLLMAHKPAASNVLVDSRNPESAVATLHANVLSAVLGGGYKPSDLLYYLQSIESMISFSDHAGGYWEPEKYQLLLLHYPTPGAAALERNLIGSH